MSEDAQDSEQTRRNFIQAATDVFYSRGFTEPTIQDICDRAGYSRRAFYAHFKNRDELIAAFLEDVFANFFREFETTRAGDISTIIANFVVSATRSERGLAGSPAWRLRHTLEACDTSDIVRRQYVACFATLMRRLSVHILLGQRDGLIRADFPADGLAGILGGLAYGTMTVVNFGGVGEVDPAMLAQTLIGLLAPPSPPGDA
jgi:AcrR family transcriptional regulator